MEDDEGEMKNMEEWYWKKSIEIREDVRKEKGIKIIVELLRMEVDSVVCDVENELRKLEIDKRKKEIIGKYEMRDIVKKLK